MELVPYVVQPRAPKRELGREFKRKWGEPLTVHAVRHLVAVTVRWRPRCLRAGFIPIAAAVDVNGRLVDKRLEVAGNDVAGALEFLLHVGEHIIPIARAEWFAALVAAAAAQEWPEPAAPFLDDAQEVRYG